MTDGLEECECGINRFGSRKQQGPGGFPVLGRDNKRLLGVVDWPVESGWPNDVTEREKQEIVESKGCSFCWVGDIE